MAAVKNFWFPICVRRREASDQHLIGVETLQILTLMTESSKEEQYLFFYNFQNQKFIKEYCGRKMPQFVRTNKRSPQTTLVIDFDNLIPEAALIVREKFQSFEKALNGKAMLLTSPSGNMHVLYVVRGALPESDYVRVQTSVISHFFGQVESFVDRGSSLSLNRGFYHSQHLVRWMEKGLVHPTPATQRKNGFFWDNRVQISYAELMDLLWECQPVEQRKIYELADDARRMLDFMLLIARSGTDAEKEKYSEQFARIMACLRQREEGKRKSRAEEICSRAQSEQYQAAVKCIESFAGEAVFRAQAVSEICLKLVQRTESGGAGDYLAGDYSDKGEARQVCLPGAGSPSNGHGSGTSGWNDRDQRVGHGTFSCDEHLLGALSNLRDVLESRGFSHKELGYRFLKNPLRGDRDRHNVSEKPDFCVFTDLVRETLDRDPRVGIDSDSSPERVFLWLRHAGRHLRAKNKSYRGVSFFASDAARCFRLCLKAQGYEIRLEGAVSSADNSVSRVAAEKLVELVSKQIPILSKGLTPKNATTARKLFREDREFLVRGAGALLTRLKRLYPVIKRGRFVDIGMEDFQEFFQTHCRKAGLLRHVFMGVLSVQSAEYIPCIRRRRFSMNPEILSDLLASEKTPTPSSPEELAALIGHGNTWQSICRYTKPLVETMGVSRTRDLWYSALDMSSANSPESRKKDVDAFLARITKSREPQNADSV